MADINRKRSAIWLHFTPINGIQKAKCDTRGKELSFAGGSTTNLASRLRAKHPSISTDIAKRQARFTSKTIGENVVAVVEPTAASASAETTNNTVASANTANVAEPDRPNAVSSASSSVITADVTLMSNARKQSNSQSRLTSFLTRPASIARKKRLDGLVLNMTVRDFQPFSVVEDAGFREFVAALDPTYILPRRQDLSSDLLPAKYSQAVQQVKTVLTAAEAICLTTDS
jgi:hypothetical protein